mmetsp:Transcript_56775/g.164423  ORF Transcript_56775/g.164423 Transcript_56775/m.164423 type:complete len:315 (+) Transcript_56775:710-1654(+)
MPSLARPAARRRVLRPRWPLPPASSGLSHLAEGGEGGGGAEDRRPTDDVGERADEEDAPPQASSNNLLEGRSRKCCRLSFRVGERRLGEVAAKEHVLELPTSSLVLASPSPNAPAATPPALPLQAEPPDDVWEHVEDKAQLAKHGADAFRLSERLQVVLNMSLSMSSSSSADGTSRRLRKVFLYSMTPPPHVIPGGLWFNTTKSPCAARAKSLTVCSGIRRRKSWRCISTQDSTCAENILSPIRSNSFNWAGSDTSKFSPVVSAWTPMMYKRPRTRNVVIRRRLSNFSPFLRTLGNTPTNRAPKIAASRSSFRT